MYIPEGCTPIHAPGEAPAEGLSVSPDGLTPVDDSYRGLSSTGYDPYGDGHPDDPHIHERAMEWFGTDLRYWERCKAVLHAGLELNDIELKSTGGKGLDWMCMGRREDDTDYCFLHPEGDTDRKRVAGRLTKHNKQQGAAKARESIAA